MWPFLGKKYSILNKIPAPLTALLIGTCVSQIFNLDIPYIGDKMGNTDANQIFSIYLPDLSRTISFLSPAFALAALAVLDSLLSCKVLIILLEKGIAVIERHSVKEWLT